MRKKHIVVVGSSFAGLSAALELKGPLGDHHDVSVISKSDQFLFTPALIRLPFGLHAKEEVTFNVRERLAEHGIRFCQEEITRFSFENHTLTTKTGTERYDYLVIATGPKPNYAAIPGLGPRGYTQSVMTLPEAERARTAFAKLLAAPGPVVIGGVQGASSFGVAYEFLFHMAQQLKQRGLTHQAPITFVTAEPCLAHLGVRESSSTTQILEHFFERLGIRAITNAVVQRIDQNQICLADGRTLPFAYAMLVPPYLGVDAVRACFTITDASGFIRVNEFYQTLMYPDVFAAGAAISIPTPDATQLPCGAPKTAQFCEATARTAAHNIVARIHGEKMLELASSRGDATWTLDASLGIDTALDPGGHEGFTSSRDASWIALAFEKYFARVPRSGPGGDAREAR